MATHVVILAQGQQSRLPYLEVPKQSLQLKACGDIPLIARTIAQVELLCEQAHITVVCGPVLAGIVRRHAEVEIFELEDPGNSSLRGCARYLEASMRRDHTVVLLGDVCYSWRCLELLMQPRQAFVGTSRLSPGSGEIWGISWERESHAEVMALLKLALSKHPPFDQEYQCGQLRQWLFVGMDQTSKQMLSTGRLDLTRPMRPAYIACDDYTRDFDVEADLLYLDEVAELAARDDHAHGLAW